MSIDFPDEKLAQRIKHTCQKLGGGMKVAGAIGINHGKVYRYMNNTADPSVGSVKELSKLSGIDLTWLLTGEGEELAVNIQKQNLRPNIKNKNFLNELAKIVDEYLDHKEIHLSFYTKMDMILGIYETEINDAQKTGDTPQANKNKIGNFIKYYVNINPSK